MFFLKYVYRILAGNFGEISKLAISELGIDCQLNLMHMRLCFMI